MSFKNLLSKLRCCDGNNSCRHDQRHPTDFLQHFTQPESSGNNNWNFLSDGLHENCRKDQLEVSSASASNPTTGIFLSAASRSDHPFICPYQSSPSMEAHTSTPPFSPLLQNQTQEPQHNAPRSRYTRASASSLTSTSTSLFTCMWGGCQAQFPSLAELVGHVNLSHLRLSADTDTSSSRGANPTETQNQIHIQVDDPTRLPCLWGDCTEFLLPEHLTGTSSTSTEDIMLSSLASHLFQDHLGLQNFGGDIQSDDLDVERLLAEISPCRQQSQDEESRGPQNGQNAPGIGSVIVAGNANSNHKEATDTGLHSFMQDPRVVAIPSSQTPTTTLSSPATSSTEITSGEGHVCLWESCGVSFETCNDLTSHMSFVHVGSGKPQYDCFWEGCMRSGDKGFSSRQKICRHLQVRSFNTISGLSDLFVAQSHTGYRPFQCPECLQNFSEAATLQQHIRRHTQESKCIPGVRGAYLLIIV